MNQLTNRSMQRVNINSQVEHLELIIQHYQA